jgi:hypothetical protein
MGNASARSVSSVYVSQSPVPMDKAAMADAAAPTTIAASTAAYKQEQSSMVSDISSATLELEHQRHVTAASTPVKSLGGGPATTEQADAIAFGTTNILPLDSREQPPLLSPAGKPAQLQPTPTLRQLTSPTIIQIAAAPISSNNTPLPSPHYQSQSTTDAAPPQSPAQPSPSTAVQYPLPSSIYASSAPSPAQTPLAQAESSSSAGSPAPAVLDTAALQAFREAVRPVTQEYLQESLDGLRYDLHLEMQEIISEQIRQFSIAKEESAAMMRHLMEQMQSLVTANEQLRSENNELRYSINKSKYTLQ